MLTEKQKEMMNSFQYLIDAIKDIECATSTSRTYYAVTAHNSFNVIDCIADIESRVPGMLLEVYEDYVYWLENQLEGEEDGEK